MKTELQANLSHQHKHKNHKLPIGKLNPAKT
jgi:hypothetical protein